MADQTAVASSLWLRGRRSKLRAVHEDMRALGCLPAELLSAFPPVYRWSDMVTVAANRLQRGRELQAYYQALLECNAALGHPATAR